MRIPTDLTLAKTPPNDVRQTVAAALAGLSLSHTIGAAMLSGLVRRERPFFRTPKRADRHALMHALAAAREEAILMLGLWLAAYGVAHIPDIDGDLTGLVGSPDLTVWVTVLLVQSVPYAAAVLVSLVSGLNLPGRWIGEAGTDAPVWADTSVPAVPAAGDAGWADSAIPNAGVAGNNGGPLPVSARLDSAK